MMVRRALFLVAAVSTACGPSVPVVDGKETGGCVDGDCLGDLICQDDQCIDPDAETESDETSETATSTSSGPSTATGTVSTTATAGTTQAEPPPPAATAVDVLFVVDDSGTMAEEQLNLAFAAGDLITGLQSFGLSVRVAATSTDNGSYWCAGSAVDTPEAGRFTTTSCLERLGDFTFLDTTADYVCTETCSLEAIPLGEGPWLDEPTPEQVACLLPQGINGCGYESQLESMWKALQRAEQPGEAEFGFLRDDAHLVVIIVSDEADCSLNPDHELAVMGPNSGRVFWSFPEDPAPNSATCWNAGVQCVGSPSGYDTCEVATYAVDGTQASSDDDAVMQPLSKYSNELQSLRALKATRGGEVFVFGLLGVPEGYSGSLLYADGPDANSRDSFQGLFGIGQGCVSDTGEAVPPVRMRAFIEDSGLAADNQIFSICAGDFGGAFSDIAARVAAYSP